MALERILSQDIRDRFGGRMSTGHTVGRCAGEQYPFGRLAPALRCAAIVSADEGYCDEVQSSNGESRLRLYYCPACAQRMQGARS